MIAYMTRRQRQVLALVAHGHTDNAIAEQLGIGPRSVHSHVANIRTALGARNRAHAVALGVQLGILYFDEGHIHAH